MKRISVLSFFYFLLALPTWADETKGMPVTLSTKDGWALSATYLPAQESKRTVILLHDLNKSKKNFAALENALAQNGIGYLAVDLRGHGASIGGGKASTFAREGVDNPFNKMTRDVDSAIDFLHKKGRSQRSRQKHDVLAGHGFTRFDQPHVQRARRADDSRHAAL